MLKNVIAHLQKNASDKPTRDDGVEPPPLPDVTIESNEEELPLGFDDVFEMLSSRRRRQILRYLDTEGEIRRGTLTELIAARENDKQTSELTAQERKRVYIALYQSHLPKMTEVNAITYDQLSGRIWPGPHFDLFLDYLPSKEIIAASTTPLEAERQRQNP